MIIKIIGVALIATAIYFLSPHWNEFWDVDACLDSGGAYDYTEQKCDYKESHPYLPSYTQNSISFYGALVIWAIGIIFILHGEQKQNNENL